ncbi:hypothetical protein ACROYT_G015420 [Oculina patagonica]
MGALHRAKRISTDLESDIKEIIEIYLKAGYPKRFIQATVNSSQPNGKGGKSEHWFSLVVMPKQNQVLALYSMAGDFLKTTVNHALCKMAFFLTDLESISLSEVVSNDEQKNTIDVEFQSERGVRYTYDVEGDFSSGELRLAKTAVPKISQYEAVTQVGAEIELYWTEEALGNTGWTAG